MNGHPYTKVCDGAPEPISREMIQKPMDLIHHANGPLDLGFQIALLGALHGIQPRRAALKLGALLIQSGIDFSSISPLVWSLTTLAARPVSQL